MKKLIIGLFLLFLFPATKSFAVELNTHPTIFENNKEYTLELIATPKSGENAIKLNIILSGADIVDFGVYNESNWLTTTSDCVNSKKFTTSSVCTTLVKESELKSNESLGLLKILVTDADNFSIFKIDGTEYSNGVSIRSDKGELFKQITLQTPVSTETPIYGDTDPIIFYMGIGGMFSVAILLAFGIYKFLRPNQATTLNI